MLGPLLLADSDEGKLRRKEGEREGVERVGVLGLEKV